MSALDVFPTVFAAATGRRPVGRLARRLDGVDLLPHLSGKEISDPHDVLYWRRGRNWAIRQGPWKLVWDKLGDGQWQLYNLATDRCEIDNLASQYPKRVDQMSSDWFAWAKRVGLKNVAARARKERTARESAS